MCIRERFYEINKQWCVTHLPDKPSGFAIMILGNMENYVEEKQCFWLDHEGRKRVLETLRENGYTIVSSNLFGKHWGNQKAIDLAKYCMYYLNKTETINEKIHIIAEGFGALIAMELAEKMKEKIRSIVLIDPIISVNEYSNKEKKNLLFYKRFQKELQKAYESDSYEITELPTKVKEKPIDVTIPMKIYCNSKEVKNNVFLKDIEESNENITLAYYINETKYYTLQNMVKFFQLQEQDFLKGEGV